MIFFLKNVSISQQICESLRNKCIITVGCEAVCTRGKNVARVAWYAYGFSALQSTKPCSVKDPGSPQPRVLCAPQSKVIIAQRQINLEM